ncbi:MAG: transcription termination factor Rho [Acetatifactor sp.]
MREKYESLALIQLKELAKVRGLKGTSTMKKAELVEAMLAEDERLKKLEEREKAEKTEKAREASAANQEPPQEKGRKMPPRRTESGVRNDTVYRSEAIAGSESMKRADYSSPRSEGARTEGTRTEGTRNEGTRNEGTRNEGTRNEGTRTENSRPEGQRPENSGTQTAETVRPNRNNEVYDEKTYPKELDSGEEASGILEVMPDGYGFIRCENYLPGENDVYVAPSQIRRFGLKTGDILRGNKRVKTQQEKFSALLFIRTINGYTMEESARRMAFEDMTPIFPDERIRLETPGCSVAMRVMDLVSPVGKGQRGMIVSPPKAGKTTLLKEVAKSILRTNPHMHMLILLIDERPEEVTDIKEAIHGDNVEVIYSTFDELPEHHKRVSEMVIERAKRLVEHKKDVVILLDSITRLTRAYNLVVPPSGRTLSGGLDPAALHMPKRFFGAARNMREGGSLTILATALVETGSKMDDVVYEEFKGTGNMEMVLDRKLSEKRIFPAIDLAKSGTRREDLLLDSEELEAINIMRKALNGMKPDEATDRILDMFSRTRNNNEFVQMVKKNKFI